MAVDADSDARAKRNDQPEQPNVILTGFMGTGKSTVGRLLAAALGYEFVDTDALIEKRAGMTIPALFHAQGEATFRAWERAVAAELATRQRLVIATGGRLMLDDENAASLERSGSVFCLAASPATIAARLARDGIKRPLLAGLDPAGRIAALLQERSAGYSRFRQIDTNGKEPAAVAAEIGALFSASGE